MLRRVFVASTLVRQSLVAATLVLAVFASASVVLADGRVALVVGNSTYAHIGRLPNPGNDAVDMAAALRRLGFEVTTELDADRGELTEALRAFTRRSAGADVALVFYAGHGLEMDGVNYLVPVDARLERDVDVRYETVTLDDLLVSTVGARLRLVLLDACRNNPLARSMQRTVASRSVSGGSFGQLDENLLGDETLVAYAAAAGTTAADGRGRNSPYTTALLAHLDQPLEILTLFRRVRARVLEATNGEQRPHEYQSLLREHYLSGAPAMEAVTVEADAPDVIDVADVDVDELDVAQLRVLAERGDADAQAELGVRYGAGRGVERDYGEAVSWYRRAAEQGEARGQLELGFAYERGRGIEQNDAEAVRWYRRAAEQGDPHGQTNLGIMYRDGRALPQDDEEAVRWFRRAAEQGHANGQANLGYMYERGRGVEGNDEEASRWYRPAAEQGLAGGQAGLGVLYRDGRGVPQDDVAAVEWFRRAADQRDVSSLYNLGWMYANGRGTRRDEAEAVRWFRRAAERGYASAQYALGWAYEAGRGVPRDRLEAARWYRLAAEQGHAVARERLERLR
ncbi:MAG: caspase family protein [Acidobacteria bacterium]|nr:caspase family protein [Acidobacteriota bacterium]